MIKSFRIGLMGLGTVGGGVVKVLRAKHDEILQLMGFDLQIVKVMSRRDNRLAELGISRDIYTSSFEDFMKTPMDLLVEVIGGEAPAQSIKEALAKGIKVITANKSLLATRAAEYLHSESSHNLFYEASCCSGIPIISAFEEGLTANTVSRIVGILNGTCNYILSEMDDKNLSFDQALKAAQKIGYAEADPSFDVEGIDASHKLCLLSSLAFRRPVPFGEIPAEGIVGLNPSDLGWAREHGYKIKLISMAEQYPGGELALGTFPALVPDRHPLGSVHGVNNAVLLRADLAGDLMFYGQGAGEMPTASAILSDIIAACQDRQRVRSQAIHRSSRTPGLVKKDAPFSFYLRMSGNDHPALGARLREILGLQGLRFKSSMQQAQAGGRVEHFFTTEPATRGAVQKALLDAGRQNLFDEPARVIRILEI